MCYFRLLDTLEFTTKSNSKLAVQLQNYVIHFDTKYTQWIDSKKVYNKKFNTWILTSLVYYSELE